MTIKLTFNGTLNKWDHTKGEPTNEYRAQRALFALSAYAVPDGDTRLDAHDFWSLEELIRDLVSDLGHLYVKRQPADADQGGDRGDAFFASLEQAWAMWMEEDLDELPVGA